MSLLFHIIPRGLDGADKISLFFCWQERKAVVESYRKILYVGGCKWMTATKTWPAFWKPCPIPNALPLSICFPAASAVPATCLIIFRYPAHLVPRYEGTSCVRYLHKPEVREKYLLCPVWWHPWKVRRGSPSYPVTQKDCICFCRKRGNVPVNPNRKKESILNFEPASGISFFSAIWPFGAFYAWLQALL